MSSASRSTPRLKKRQVQLIASGDLRPQRQPDLLARAGSDGRALGGGRRRRAATSSSARIRTSETRSTASSPRRRRAWRSFATTRSRRAAHRRRGGLAIFASRAAGLTTHRGPILTVANWSGHWPGLVGMLNLNGSLTKAGVKYSTLWSEDFTDDALSEEAREVAEERHGQARHAACHAARRTSSCRAQRRKLGEALAAATAAREGDHGRLRRRLHGDVQRDHPRRAAATRPASSRSGSASRRSTTKRRR